MTETLFPIQNQNAALHPCISMPLFTFLQHLHQVFFPNMEPRVFSFLLLSMGCWLVVLFFFFLWLDCTENVLFMRMYLRLVLSHGRNHNDEVSSWEGIAHVFLPVTLKGHLLRKIKLIQSRGHGFATWLCVFNSLWTCL